MREYLSLGSKPGIISKGTVCLPFVRGWVVGLHDLGKDSGRYPRNEVSQGTVWNPQE